METASPIVLYVEDEEGDRLLMQMAFSKVGLLSSLRMVTTGQEAIDYLAGEREYAERTNYPLPTLVLLDLNLPEIHGFEVLKWIRAHPLHRALPVVIFSSSIRGEDRSQTSVLGANEFLCKPSSLGAFRDIVRQLNQRWLLNRPPTICSHAA